jgi:hypothetical protein
VLKWIFYFIIVGYNVKGTGLMVKSLNKSTVNTSRSVTQPEAFCDPVVLNLARSVNALIYFSLIAYIVITLMNCYKIVRARKTTKAETVEKRGISSRKNKFNRLPWAGFAPVPYGHRYSELEDIEEEGSDLDYSLPEMDEMSDLELESPEEDESEDEQSSQSDKSSSEDDTLEED